MVEIIQKTAACSTTNPNCNEHQHKTITNVCMKCEIGLCSRCFASPSMMKNHSGHEILDIEDAFEKLRKPIDTLAEKGRKACKLLDTESQVIKERKTVIERCSSDLASAYACRHLGAFSLLRKLSLLLDTTQLDTINDNQNLAASTKNISDNNCTDEALKRALDSLDHGMLTIKTSKGKNTAHSIACQKLAAVTFLIDILRMNPLHQDVKDTLEHLWNLCHESEACCSRVVFLGGADLIMSCFEASITDQLLCCYCLCVYGMLAAFPSLHTHLMSCKAVNVLVYGLQNFSGDEHFACKPLSFFLCSSIRWPEQCPSRKEVSALVIDACKNTSLGIYVAPTWVSFGSHVSLLSQNVSAAAKYWAVLTLYWCINQHPEYYCPILARDGGVNVLKQQSNAHEYVQRLAKLILKKFDEHNSYNSDLLWNHTW